MRKKSGKKRARMYYIFVRPVEKKKCIVLLKRSEIERVF